MNTSQASDSYIFVREFSDETDHILLVTIMKTPIHTATHNNIYLKSHIHVYQNTSSVDCTQYGLYNLKQYDHNQILNDLLHISLLHTINFPFLYILYKLINLNISFYIICL